MFDSMTALKQLTRSDNPKDVLKHMLGTRKYYGGDEEDRIGFDFKMCRKCSVCNIYYEAGKDLYRVEFLRRKRGSLDEFVVVETRHDVFWGELKKIFEEVTGLYLSL